MFRPCSERTDAEWHPSATRESVLQAANEADHCKAADQGRSNRTANGQLSGWSVQVRVRRSHLPFHRSVRIISAATKILEKGLDGSVQQGESDAHVDEEYDLDRVRGNRLKNLYHQQQQGGR